MSFFHVGGAAGHCPPVQKVTDYSSTSIVCLKFLRPLRLKDKQKCLIGHVVKFPPLAPLRTMGVSDMNITLQHTYVAWSVKCLSI